MLKSRRLVMSFGKYLRNERKKARLTQKQLAEKLQLQGLTTTDAYISMIERSYDKRKDGRDSRPDEKVVEAIADVLGLPKSEVRVAAGYAPLTDIVPANIKAIGFNGLDENDLKEIEEFIRFKKSQKKET